MGNLYALDFDGVICDSCGESSISALKAAKVRWPSLFNGVDLALEEWILDQMHTVRPVVETGYENLLLVRLLLETRVPSIRKSSVAEGLTVDGILENWSKLKPIIMEEWGENREFLVDLFGKVRDEWIETDLSTWIGANRLYPGVSDALKFASSKIYIVTTKQSRFAAALLRELAGVTIPPERIYGLGTGPKVETLKKLQNQPEHQGLTLHTSNADSHASSSFTQRIRDLPFTFPGTNIKTHVSQLIGRTPIVFLKKVSEGCGAYIAVKQEMTQPTASIKDRPALAMLEDAEKKGLISPGKTVLIEPTSGNMGISMAFMAAMKGYKMVLTMPSYTSLERRVTMRAFGAELILTDPDKGMGGTVNKAYQLLDSTPDAFMLQQFSNPANTQVHFETTGPEIWEDTQGKVDIFVMGIGSGGTISGVGQYLKSQNPNVKFSRANFKPLLKLDKWTEIGPHLITGNGVGFKPDILDMDVMDEVLEIKSDDAVKMARQLALKEGLMVGISSGANTVAALELAKRPENKGKLIVTIHPSFGERYLSSALFQDLRKEAEQMQPVSVD
ncbi:hypothetical protein KSS87_019779 [Heliosperma pusillum]|nr:hypothetical protein KSS87_019779 [Heliosperma pusillum]